MHDDEPASDHPAGDPPDSELVLAARDGDDCAFAELWRRHYRSGMLAARSITQAFDADDLVQESFAAIYSAIKRGGGPTAAFRPYLLVTIRNTAAAWGRARREHESDNLESVADPASSDGALASALDQTLSVSAFRSLPSRWQEVLWYTEVEQLKPAAVAPLLGLKPVAVAQLAFRAREGLRVAWIQQHLQSLTGQPECEWTVSRLGAYTRGNTSRTDSHRIASHLRSCARCPIVAEEAENVASRIALVLLPLALGVTGATGYLASLQSESSAAVAMAMGHVAPPESGMTSSVGVSGSPGVPGAAHSHLGSPAGRAAWRRMRGLADARDSAHRGAAVATFALAILTVGATGLGMLGAAGSSPATADGMRGDQADGAQGSAIRPLEPGQSADRRPVPTATPEAAPKGPRAETAPPDDTEPGARTDSVSPRPTTPAPAPTSKPKPTPTSTPTPTPVAVPVTVPGRSVSVSTGITLTRGQKLVISARGRTQYGWEADASCGGQPLVDADGARVNEAGQACAPKLDPRAPLPDVPVGTLIGRIGGGAWFAVGSRFVTSGGDSGELVLRINDSVVEDNAGGLSVSITVR